jgi:hypothetical protein
VISDTHQVNSQIVLPRMMMMPVRNKGQVWHPLAIIKERNKMWI